MTKMWAIAHTHSPVRYVEADYVVIDHGHLLFRNNVRGTYPQLVQACAPGTWSEVMEHGKTFTRTKAPRENIGGCFHCSG